MQPAAAAHPPHLGRSHALDPQAIVKLGEGFNGADMRNICTEAGLFAIRAERDYVVQEDFMKVSRARRVWALQQCGGPARNPAGPLRAPALSFRV